MRRRRVERADGAEAAQAEVTLAGGSILAPSGEGRSDLPAGSQDAVDVEATAGGADSQRRVSAWLFAPGRAPTPIDLAALRALVADDANFVWVDLSGYTEADLQRVAEPLGLPRKAVRAALSPWQRPRLAVSGDQVFVSATVARLQERAYRIQAGQLDLFAGNNFLVSAHKSPLPFAAHLRERALASPHLVALDSSFMLYLVLDELLAYYEELDRHIEGAIELLEERALRDTSDAFLEDLRRFKRYTFALTQLADQHRDVFAAFLRPDFPWVAGAEEVADYFEDLEARLGRLLESLAAARDDVNGAFDLYVSHIAHRTNAVIKVLTIVSTVLFSASVIIALFGATLQGTATYGPGGFAAMAACLVLVSVAIVAAFRRQRWL